MTSVFDKAKTKRLKQVTTDISEQSVEASDKLIQQYQCVTKHCLNQPSSKETRKKLEEWHSAHQAHAINHNLSPPHEN